MKMHELAASEFPVPFLQEVLTQVLKMENDHHERDFLKAA